LEKKTFTNSISKHDKNGLKTEESHRMHAWSSSVD